MTLHQVGGNECALNFESHGGCSMEEQQREPNYFKCSFNERCRGALRASQELIRLNDGHSHTATLGDWARANGCGEGLY